ncbi:MAG: TetR/AcrR family transcriptional regulator [Pseudomonadota bacterium]
MARRQQGEDTRNRIIEAAADLFHRDGIHAVSVDDVLAASGTGKSQMYHYFRSKDDLVLAVAERLRDGAKGSPLAIPIDSWEGVEAWLRVHVTAMAGCDFARGCPVGTLAYARPEDHEALRTPISATYNIQRASLIAFFESRLSTVKDSPWDAQALATLCLATIQGSMILARSDGSAEAMEQSIDSLLKLLKGALGEDRL